GILPIQIAIDLQTRIKESRYSLDAWVREIVQWHFDPATGCPFWLDFAKTLDWHPGGEIRRYEDRNRFVFFRDEGLGAGPYRRWVIKLLKMKETELAEQYKKHVIEQALTLLRAHDSIRCLFTTPKLLEALCEKVSLKRLGIKGVFCGGTEMTPQFYRFAVEEL